MIKLCKEYIESAFESDSTIEHLKETSKIVMELNSNCSEELVLAALLHDIERSDRKEDVRRVLKNNIEGFSNKDFLELHQKRGAEIAYNLLVNYGYNVDSAVKVKNIIERHEIGGNSEQDLLMNADSLSFFRVNVKSFIDKNIYEQGIEKVTSKIDWMYNRMNNEKAKELALPLYKEAKGLLK